MFLPWLRSPLYLEQLAMQMTVKPKGPNCSLFSQKQHAALILHWAYSRTVLVVRTLGFLWGANTFASVSNLLTNQQLLPTEQPTQQTRTISQIANGKLATKYIPSHHDHGQTNNAKSRLYRLRHFSDRCCNLCYILLVLGSNLLPLCQS